MRADRSVVPVTAGIAVAQRAFVWCHLRGKEKIENISIVIDEEYTLYSMSIELY